MPDGKVAYVIGYFLNIISWLSVKTNMKRHQVISVVKRVEFKHIVLIPMLLLVITINGVDFIDDIQQGDEWLHIGLQVVTLILSSLGLWLIIRLILESQHQVINFERQIEKAEKDLSLSKIKLQEVGRQYRKYIYEQFDEWKLTPSEQEVALLTLKGLSFKEIATVRKTKEKTVRQQATMIYRKSAVSGRHEFSAWFFEDILQSVAGEGSPSLN